MKKYKKKKVVSVIVFSRVERVDFEKNIFFLEDIGSGKKHQFVINKAFNNAHITNLYNETIMFKISSPNTDDDSGYTWEVNVDRVR